MIASSRTTMNPAAPFSATANQGFRAQRPPPNSVGTRTHGHHQPSGTCSDARCCGRRRSHDHRIPAAVSRPSPRRADTGGTNRNRHSDPGKATFADGEHLATGHCIPASARVLGARHGRAADKRSPAAISAGIPGAGTRFRRARAGKSGAGDRIAATREQPSFLGADADAGRQQRSLRTEELGRFPDAGRRSRSPASARVRVRPRQCTRPGQPASRAPEPERAQRRAHTEHRVGAAAKPRHGQQGSRRAPIRCGPVSDPVFACDHARAARVGGARDPGAVGRHG
jgi:hypothetical protein